DCGQRPGHRRIDAVTCAAGDDVCGVDDASARTENAPVLRVFQRRLFGWQRKCCGERRELTVADASAVLVLDDTGFGVQLACRCVPLLRRGGEQDLSNTRTGVTQIGPRVRNVRAAARALFAVLPGERTVGCAHDAERQLLDA